MIDFIGVQSSLGGELIAKCFVVLPCVYLQEGFAPVRMDRGCFPTCENWPLLPLPCWKPRHPLLASWSVGRMQSVRSCWHCWSPGTQEEDGNLTMTARHLLTKHFLTFILESKYFLTQNFHYFLLPSALSGGS